MRKCVPSRYRPPSPQDQTKLTFVQAKKAQKAAERPAPAQSSKPKVAASALDEELPPHKYFEVRSKKINELRSTKNPDPYPHKFQTTMTIPEFIDKYTYLKRGEQVTGTEIAMAGRCMVIRDNNKLKFYDLHGEVSTPQQTPRGTGLTRDRAAKSRSPHRSRIVNLKKLGRHSTSFAEVTLLASVDSLAAQTPKAKNLPERGN